MTIGIADKRPPFVRFEERELGINAEATERAGRPIPKVVTLACITPHGSKDVFEKLAEDWLKQIKQQALMGSYPLEWSNYFHASYEEWKKGNELPREGTPVKTWQAATKEQGVRLHAFGITTVEDLAQIPDSGLNQIGPDGRYLRDLAKNWIAEAKDKGIVAKQIADSNSRIEDLERQNAELRRTLGELKQQLEQPKRAARPSKSSLMEEDAA